MRTLTNLEEEQFLLSLCPDWSHADYPTLTWYHDLTTATNYKQIRNLLAALLMLDCGLRVGEVIRLRLSDCYFNGKPVNSLTVRAEIAKGHNQRIIPTSLRLQCTLRTFTPEHLLLADWPLTQSLIAHSRQGKRLTTRTLERIFERHSMKSLGFPVRPHMLRHTFGTRLMKVTDIRTVQELLGHKHLSSTQIYTHVNDEDKRRAIDKMQDLSSMPPEVPPRRQLPG